MTENYSEITPYIKRMAERSDCHNGITNEMYALHDVKRGLRDVNGRGVVTGLTEVSAVNGRRTLPDGTDEYIEGELRYRGVDVKELVRGYIADDRHGFEEAAYLLLFSELPNAKELEEFKAILSSYRTLPQSFVRDMVMKAPGRDMMNMLSRTVLALYAYDLNPDDISTANVLRQGLTLLARFPLLAVYGYQAHQHYNHYQSLFIHYPKPEYDTAENLLYLLRENGEFTPLEAKLLDLALVLHAEHGGGNNSSFTTRVVTSSGTDTYSAVAAALGSLKGPRHGGANLKVVQMFDDLKANVNTKSDAEIEAYLHKLLNREAFDRAGLIYGIGHAIYAKSDPRAEILRAFAEKLSEEKGMQEEFALYEKVAKLAPQLVAEKRQTYKEVSPNVDFYSGLVYRMLGLPLELFTPIFAVSRIAGWTAHRIEELQSAGKIIRPAYINVGADKPYIEMSKRK